MEPQKDYYWVEGPDDNKCYFETSDKFLKYLSDNGPTKCGCDLLTDSQWKKIEAVDPDTF